MNQSMSTQSEIREISAEQLDEVSGALFGITVTFGSGGMQITQGKNTYYFDADGTAEVCNTKTGCHPL